MNGPKLKKKNLPPEKIASKRGEIFTIEEMNEFTELYFAKIYLFL